MPGAPSRGTARGTALLRMLGGGAARLGALLFTGFVLFHVIPGDPVLSLTAGRPVTADEIVQRRAELGLDRPLPEQFASYVAGVLHGDLGVSYAYRRPVTELIAERLWPTLLLVGGAGVLALAIGVVTGARAGWRPGTAFDRLSTSAALVLWATPTAWLGLILLVVLGAGAGPIPGVLPTGGMRSTPPEPGAVAAVTDVAAHLVLPCLTLVAVQYAQYHVLMRSSILAERDLMYITVARATGLRDAAVRRRHAVPNAVLPTLTQAFLSLGFVVSGAITVEAVFSWPGLGYLTYEALQVPDLPVLHGTFLLLSASVIVAGTLTELARKRLDPRTESARPA